MGKRTRVPAALHSELSEYSSLIRALRTSDTLDLASQLTAPAPTLVSSHDADDEADDGESERFPADTFAVSVDGSQASSSKPRQRTKAKRDLWTRWPLLAGDVHVPEWTLEDEVKLLAVRALRNDPFHTEPIEQQYSQSESEGEDGDSPMHADISDVEPPIGEPGVTDDTDGPQQDHSDTEQLLTPQFLANLTSSSGVFLARILALSAAYVPPSEKSMQNRVHPIGWQSVLDIAAANGLANSTIVERVRQRLLTLDSDSGPSHSFSDDDPLRRACAAYDGSYLTIDGYVSQSAQPKRKRGPYRKRKLRNAPEVDSGDDQLRRSNRQKSS